MSAPQQFATITAALEAFAAGRCRRWVSVDGHQIDLVQAQAEAGRVRDDPAAIAPPAPASIAAAILHDLDVGRNVLAELARAAHVLPELAPPEMPAPPPVECCRACGRPLIGAVGRAGPTVVVLGDGYGDDSRRVRERKAYEEHVAAKGEVKP